MRFNKMIAVWEDGYLPLSLRKNFIFQDVLDAANPHSPNEILIPKARKMTKWFKNTHFLLLIEVSTSRNLHHLNALSSCLLLEGTFWLRVLFIQQGHKEGRRDPDGLHQSHY